eukprot:sb/3476027/
MVMLVWSFSKFSCVPCIVFCTLSFLLSFSHFLSSKNQYIMYQEPTETSKQPIRTRYLGHVTGYQPIRDQYFLIRSVPDFTRLTFCLNKPPRFNGILTELKKCVCNFNNNIGSYKMQNKIRK